MRRWRVPQRPSRSCRWVSHVLRRIVTEAGYAIWTIQWSHANFSQNTTLLGPSTSISVHYLQMVLISNWSASSTSRAVPVTSFPRMPSISGRSSETELPTYLEKRRTKFGRNIALESTRMLRSPTLSFLPVSLPHWNSTAKLAKPSQHGQRTPKYVIQFSSWPRLLTW